ncbi:hypothetical protein F511_37906 [Dorcoceras hygrometricum]|uniref:Uncharacterized protein n=1 Tax=Dorcoceras hygrometricum TaxID=472368 RepID=A0A2Z7CA21_9LAMI|nr:hypothetical protein F511_37906 [Dorcoceras hygrometricum]
MMRRRAGDSADAIVLMMSSVTSSDSADGLRKQSQESAGSLHPDARGSDVQSKLQWIQSQRKDFQTQCFGATRRKQQQHPVERLFESAVAIYSVARFSVQSQEIQAQRIEEVAKRSSRSDKSAAKQLTIYESWMSTAELNSNGESDKKPAKEKDASTVPLSVLYREAIYTEATPLKKDCVRDVGATTTLLLKLIDYTVHQQRENESEVKLSITIRERALLQIDSGARISLLEHFPSV